MSVLVTTFRQCTALRAPHVLRSQGNFRQSVRMSSSSKITFGDKLPGHYVNKDTSAKSAVVVVQEWWGIVPEVIRQAEYISKELKVPVLVPDLYKGSVGVEAEEAKHMMDNLDFPQAAKEINQAAEHLRNDGAEKVGVVGFCMGGALAFLSAQGGSFDAVVGFYGAPPGEARQVDKIKAPCQGHSGSEDSFKGFADPATMKEFLDSIKGAKTEFYEYKGEGHGFMNADEKDIQDKMRTAELPKGSKEAQELAWKRTFQFLKANLA
ncbi:hypothetical protein WJX73_009952 [Symbiochloris irregularis]|uniref:Dienelactone hydrolase domain-containing protein n=1 Tax=Symbiochloris irregularis TaxID=706552 RepID=A0AAW1NUB1_9CHLO